MATNFQTEPSEVNAGASKIHGDGISIRTSVGDVYSTLQVLGTSWVGTSYNKLVQSFDAMLPTLNDVCSFIQYSIPETLIMAMNNYLSADGGTKLNTSFNRPLPVGEISQGPTETVKFDEAVVEDGKSHIKNQFDSILSELDSVIETVNSLRWSGEAADTVREALQRYKQQLSENFTQVSTQFQTSIEETRAAFSSAEGANTVTQ